MDTTTTSKSIETTQNSAAVQLCNDCARTEEIQERSASYTSKFLSRLSNNQVIDDLEAVRGKMARRKLDLADLGVIERRLMDELKVREDQAAKQHARMKKARAGLGAGLRANTFAGFNREQRDDGEGSSSMATMHGGGDGGVLRGSSKGKEKEKTSCNPQ